MLHTYYSLLNKLYTILSKSASWCAIMWLHTIVILAERYSLQNWTVSSKVNFAHSTEKKPNKGRSMQNRKSLSANLSNVIDGG